MMRFGWVAAVAAMASVGAPAGAATVFVDFSVPGQFDIGDSKYVSIAPVTFGAGDVVTVRVTPSDMPLFRSIRPISVGIRLEARTGEPAQFNVSSTYRFTNLTSDNFAASGSAVQQNPFGGIFSPVLSAKPFYKTLSFGSLEQTFTILSGPTRTFTVAGLSIAGNVPEPATWAMMIGGVGMIGGSLRRRRNAVRPIAA